MPLILLLVTSFTESGPLVVKEAMACNLSIVSTRVGDMPMMLEGTDGAYVTSYDPSDVAEKLGRSDQVRKKTRSKT